MKKNVFRLNRGVRIAYEPILWNAQGDPKDQKQILYIKTVVFGVKSKILQN